MENNWIENVSGECPVASGTLIDVQFREGVVREMIAAGDYNWRLHNDFDDITHYRLHKPEQSLDEAIGQQSYPEDFTVQQELTYPQTTFKPSSEAQLRADEEARISNKLSEKLSTISDTLNKITGKNFSIADIKLVKSLLLSVEEYEENR